METPAPYTPDSAKGVLVVDPPQQHVEVGHGITLMHPLELIRQVTPFVENANELSAQAERAVINSDDAYNKGTEFLSSCTQQWNQIESIRTTAKKPVDDFARFIQNQCTPAQGLLTTAKRKLGDLMLAYRRKVEADRAAAAEIVRKAQEAEALKLAEQEQDKGNTGVAAAILDAATTMPAPRPAAPIGGARTNSFGRSTNVASRWVGSPAEPMTILAAIIKGNIPVSCIEWNQAELNKVAKAVGVVGVFNGVKVEKSDSLRQV
jgi:hypothetical protein